jgi:hypothetical protein
MNRIEKVMAKRSATFPRNGGPAVGALDRRNFAGQPVASAGARHHLVDDRSTGSGDSPPWPRRLTARTDTRCACTGLLP